MSHTFKNISFFNGKITLVILVIDNKIKECRNELEMTQSELGSIFDVHKSTVSNWENGYDIIPLSKLIKFCIMYNYSLDYVTGLSKEDKKYSSDICTDKKKIGKKLKEFRKSLKLTQTKISNECSISREAYCHYELGINLINTLTLYTICKNYNLSMDEFLRLK